MVSTYDEERIREDDRVLVVIPNQYMLRQVLWYHTEYPEGIWEAIVVPYGRKEAGKKTQKAIYRECEKSGIFSRVVLNSELRERIGDSRLQQMKYFFKYLGQCLTHSRGKYDFQIISRVMGDCDYRKVLIHPSSMMCTAAVNAVREVRDDAVIICMEDGMADYGPPANFLQFRKCGNPRGFMFCYILSKLNILNNNAYGHFEMEYDNEIIKYVSLPDKMQCRNFKRIKPLFEGKEKDMLRYIEKNHKGKKYNLIIFSAPLTEDFKLQNNIGGGGTASTHSCMTC